MTANCSINQMMSCYMLDVAFSLLCGPIYKLVTCLLWQCLVRRQHVVGRSSTKVREYFFDAQGFFTVTTLIATVVRLEQSPPLFEITFLQSLSWTLLLSYHTMFWSLLSDLLQEYKGHFNTREFSLPMSKWIVHLSLDVPLDMVVYTSLVLGLGLEIFTRSQSQKVLSADKRAIVDQCVQYSAIAPDFEHGDRTFRLAVFGGILSSWLLLMPISCS